LKKLHRDFRGTAFNAMFIVRNPQVRPLVVNKSTDCQKSTKFSNFVLRYNDYKEVEIMRCDGKVHVDRGPKDLPGSFIVTDVHYQQHTFIAVDDKVANAWIQAIVNADSIWHNEQHMPVTSTNDTEPVRFLLGGRQLVGLLPSHFFDNGGTVSVTKEERMYGSVSKPAAIVVESPDVHLTMHVHTGEHLQVSPCTIKQALRQFHSKIGTVISKKETCSVGDGDGWILSVESECNFPGRDGTKTFNGISKRVFLATENHPELAVIIDFQSFKPTSLSQMKTCVRFARSLRMGSGTTRFSIANMDEDPAFPVPNEDEETVDRKGGEEIERPLLGEQYEERRMLGSPSSRSHSA
jgi:hypothetical protein